MPIRDAVSAGGVVWRRTPAGVEVVLCGRTAGNIWGLPKGTPDKDEPLPDTAVREVQEETGLLVRRGEQLSTIDYWFVSGGIRFHKQVHHWLMEPVGGSLEDHDHEFDAAEWFTAEDALKRMTYPNERRIVAEAVARVEGGK